MTDREAIIATFNAVAILYERLFREPISVDVQTEDGLIRITSSSRAGYSGNSQGVNRPPIAPYIG